MAEITFLHFTDLHWGQHNSGHLWPTYKNALKEDLKKLRDKIGSNWDFVFFTGDLAFSGQPNEYAGLTNVLQEIWSWFQKDGFDPLFIPVPGNHDLKLFDDVHPMSNFRGCWEENNKLRDEFWDNPNSYYRNTLQEAFKGYTDWISSRPVSMPDNFQSGILPGDFSLSISLNGFNLGIIGLNSAFLQLTRGNYKGKIVLSARQINPIMDYSPDDWCKKNHFNILMTHHGPSWFSDSALGEFNADIYPPGRFNLHMFGHLHKARASEHSEGGATTRKFRQGSSLLGLEKYGTKDEIRIHGYTGNKIVLQTDFGLERYWPRILFKRTGGHYGFDPDISFERDSDDAVFSQFSYTSEKAYDFKGNDQTEIQSISPDIEEANLIDGANSALEQSHTEIGEKKSASLPRFTIKRGAHHQVIRQTEQASLEKTLREKRCGIIVSDWGLGKIGFFGTVIARLEKYDPVEVFKVSCNEAESLEEMDTIFQQQLGFSFQETMNLLSDLSRPVLFIDDFSSKLLEKVTENKQTESLLEPLLDFCPTLLIVLATRQTPKAPHYDVIFLNALEIPDTQQYIQHHDLAGEELKDPAVIETIHIKSDGLPMHLDRIIEQLQVCTLHEVLTSDDEALLVDDDSEPIPSALKKAVGSLIGSSDKYKRRSFKLLQVLSFLPSGESLSELKRVFPREPFFSQNALDLFKLDLVRAEKPMEFTKTETLASDLFRSGVTGEEKRLVVPRQVRDYVISITPETDLVEITRATLFLMFGDAWTSGEASFKTKRKRVIRGTGRGVGPGNEHAVIVSYLKQAIKESEDLNIRKAIKLAINLATAYSHASKYRDCAIVADEYLAITSGLLTKEENKHLSIQLAKGLRMTGKREKSLAILDSVIENNDAGLTNREIAEIELLRALILERINDENGALKAANQVLDHAQKGSYLYDHALSLIIGIENKGEKRVTDLIEHEKAVRNRKNFTVANNIALNLIPKLTDEMAKKKALDRVIKCKEDLYNRIRALIKKAELSTVSDSSICLNTAEKAMLRQAYSFLFTQRLGALFDQCHKVLWNVLNDEKNEHDLLVMFRLSSFVWRLQGDSDTEKNYVEQLLEVIPKSDKISNSQKRIMMALAYFKKRLLFFHSDA